MKTTLALSFFLAAVFFRPAAAEAPADINSALAGNGTFLDPVLQDYMETADGYLNSKNTMKIRTDFSDFRDSPVSSPVPSLKNPVPAKIPPAAAAKIRKADLPVLPPGHYKVTFAGESGPVGSFVWPLGTGVKRFAREYVFISVTPAQKDRSALLSRLEAGAGFRFAGEKSFYSMESKRTVLLGWVPSENVARVSRIAGVSRVSVEKKDSGVPLKTRVRFTLKVPYQNRPNAFVPDFIKGLSEHSGFSAETWFRLPKKNPDSKFSVFEVAGTLPVDMISDLSRSPFVACVEFSDASL